MLEQNVNPLALALLLVACLVVWFSTRQRAVCAVLVTALFIPLGQMFVVAGLHLRFLPILILVALGRIVIKGELGRMQRNQADKLFFAWCVVSLVMTCIRGANATNFGDFFNAVGAYLVFRSLTTEAGDVVAALRFLGVLAVGLGMIMLYEHSTGRNPFAVLGGVDVVDDVRDGKVRCQGAFRHPLMAGAFGATMLPLMFGLWLQGGRNRRFGTLGLAGSVVITFTAASSGAVLTLMAAAIGIALWQVREKMSYFRRGLVAMTIALQIVMKVPVWYVIAKVSDVFGGSGWHRSFLIDQFVRFFDEWWLVGTSNTAHWAPGGLVIEGNSEMMDITNHYIAQALLGGLLGLILFIWLLVSCFKIVGRLVRAGGCENLDAKFIWMLGVTLGAHCVAFISVWYFDQINTYWTWLVAAISSLAAIHAHMPAAALEAEGPADADEEEEEHEPQEQQPTQF
jgi:hypothetical protein